MLVFINGYTHTGQRAMASARFIYTHFIVDTAQRMTLFYTSHEPASSACCPIALVHPLASKQPIGPIPVIQTQYGKIQGSKTVLRDSKRIDML